MKLLEAILDWSTSLPEWQSDAVARLLTKQSLDDQDEEDILALLKTAHGIVDPKNRVPKPLAAEQIPASQGVETRVTINAIKNLKHVNAIAENQRLEFGPTGLTVIYGDNGSGKSGYSRILKRACRARDQDEQVFPNVHLTADRNGIAQADFEITVAGSPKEVRWIATTPPPAELSSLAIFDSRCARAYLDNEDDFSYVPYGLDVFESLGKLCKQLQSVLEREQVLSKPDLTAFEHLRGDTAVGKLIGSLSFRTLSSSVEALATMTMEESERHAELAASLKENNPKEKAQLLQIRARRISALADKAVSRADIVSKTSIERLRQLCDGYKAAKDAAAIAARKFNEAGELLPGTGGEAWKELFEAARKFAVESHPDKTFPDLGSESLCPLCQEPLRDGADRLKHFEEFLQKEAERVSKAKREALVAVYTPFVGQDLTVGLDDVTYGEIESLEPGLAAETRAFEVAIKARHESIKSAVKNAAVTNEWVNFENELAEPSPRLRSLVAKLEVEIETLRKAADDNSRVTLQREFEELDGRIRLGRSKQALLNTISKLLLESRLASCIRALRTNAISAKATELTEQVVSTDLANALNTEFAALGVASLQIALRSRTVRGKTLHKLALQLPQSRNPSDILSEGEQRAIAIGSFLAEIGLLDSNDGIVFDDPMSSLDHKRRERVAKRLAIEGNKRQVIVFTHDIYFVCLLAEEAQSLRVPVITQSLTRRAAGFGVCESELPFEGRNTSKRIGALKVQHQTISKLQRDGDEAEWAKQTVEAYFRLRMTWERAVEEVLFRSVVLRFKKGISTQLLSGVVVDDSDYSSIFDGMAKCSNYAHDKAMEGGVALPEPAELLADIESLESWRKSVESRAAATTQRRKR